jgi:hypothetical protein
MTLWCKRKTIRRRCRDGSGAIGAGIREVKLRSASIKCKPALTTLMAFLVISPFMAAAQKPSAPAKSATAASQPAGGQFPKLWHIDAAHKDFRVEVKGDVFYAEWVNLPAEAAKQGAYIRTTCRRSGTKWVGTSSVLQEFADPKSPAGKDIKKLCHLTVRFEVDSITPEKITYHSEVLRDWDYSKCQILKSAWEEFTWVPKK